ncbi:MAG: TrmH family RNA methyltransferase [Candidatus Paceibacterota bacterium]
MTTTYLVLHNIRSAHNVGSIFRTADAAGVEKIFLTGYTPTPIDRHGRARKDIAKTALGAEQTVSWEYSRQPATVISRLKTNRIQIVGVEQDERAGALRDFSIPERVCWILGNEVHGLSSQLRDRCNELVEIPMHGTKESLNVAVAAGIVLFCGRC